MYRVYLARHFLKQLKSLVRKYPNLENDLISSLENFNRDLAAPLGRKLYKVRLKSSDIRRGKSKSMRVITFLLEYKNLIVPITIFFKGAEEDLSDKEIEYHFERVVEEMENDNLL